MTVNLMVGTKTYAVSNAFAAEFNTKASDNVINFQDIVALQTTAGANTTIESKFIKEQLQSGGISKKITVSGDDIVVTNKHTVTAALLQNFITMSADKVLSGKEINQLKDSATGTGTGTTSESLFISALVGSSSTTVKPKTLAVGALIGIDSNGEPVSNTTGTVSLYQA